MFSYRYEAFCICIIILHMIIYRTCIHASTGSTPFFLMHFREAKLPVHVQVESVVGVSSLPQILIQLEHLKHTDVFRSNIVPKLHRIFSVHKPDRSYTMIKT